MLVTGSELQEEHSTSARSFCVVQGKVSTSFIDNMRASLVAQMVKNLPVMWETQIRSLHWEDPLEKEMANHANILAWRISWTEEPGGLESMGFHRVGHDWAANT